MPFPPATIPERLAGRQEPAGDPAFPTEAYAHCRSLAREHYENFPVASLLIPGRLRGPVAAIYAFARRADDFADEPAYEGRRLALLESWSRQLERSAAGEASDPIFVALSDVFRRHHLPSAPFQDLLSAFRQDALRSRYQGWAEVLDYCRRSANPIGRLVLLLFGHRDESLFGLSDSLCTALQLTNFWQDLAVDAKRGRIYVPLDEMARHGLPEASLASGEAPGSAGFLPLMEDMARRTRELFEDARSLPHRIGGRLGFELRLTWLGGMRILEESRRIRFDVFRHRPTLGVASRTSVLLRACLSAVREGG
ncbi:MAG TPA: squalene synthase HpnC [Candidatus Polarisedimenticolia bacterium]|nr:squalene synthase HpnC [Candidatus Polarisedimenticolia bacterium]